MEASSSLLLAIISCGVVVVAVALLYAWKILNWAWIQPKHLEKWLTHQGFKGNPYTPFFGDFKEMATLQGEAKATPMTFSNHIVPRVAPTLHKTLQTYGKNCYQWFGPRPTVFIWEPELIREVFSKSYVFQKPPLNPGVGRMSKGIVWHEKDKWAMHRKLMNPAFHLEKLKLMIPSFYLSCAEMLNKWDGLVPNEGSVELDVWPFLQTLTSDVISRTAFGSSYEEGRRIFELQQEQAQRIMRPNATAYLPGWRFLPTERNRRMKELKKEIDSSVMNIVNKRIRAEKAGQGCGNDLLGLLLESNLKEIGERGNMFGMTLQEVVEECKLFYFAGQETTSSLLVWTMILLSKHADWQERAREEVLQVFGRGQPEYQGLNHLKNINMIFHEVMRLYPPAIILLRMIKQEGTLLGDLKIPSGVCLLLPLILLHHDKKIWGDDAQEFNPERFSEGVSKATQGQMVYFPFGGGPRVCIGQNFAMVEAKMAMAMILQNYSFELSPSYSHAPCTMVTIIPQHGAHLILRKIKD